MRNPLVLYHAACMDGFCAAWIVRKAYPDAEFRAVSYWESPPDVSNRNVIIVDFSYKRPILEEMRSKAAYLRVYDHHKTAVEDLQNLSYCYFNMEKSGARIMWDVFLYPSWCLNKPDTPQIILYIEDRDLWKFKLPYSKEVNAALASYPKDFAVWDELEKKDLNELITEGKAILRYQNQMVDFLASQAEEIEIGGYRIPSVNSPLLQSEIGNKLAQGYPFSAVWYEQRGRRKFSLRSTEEGLDVSEIARKYEGGGHRNASGFTR